MKQDTTYNIFFAQQVEKRSEYELYVKGKGTGVIITKTDIMRMLSAVQYAAFESGDVIFMIEKSIINPYIKNQRPIDQKKRWPAL